MGQDIFGKFLEKVGSVPGIRIDRDSFLRTTFGRSHRKELDRIIMQGPIAAGIPLNEISEIANQSITKEALEVTAVSAGTGVLGGGCRVDSSTCRYRSILWTSVQNDTEIDVSIWLG